MDKNLIKWSVISFVLVVLAAFVLPGAVPISSLRLETFDSPIMTPVPGPTATPPVPEETQRVLKYITDRERIPIEQLAVVNQHRREYESLGRAFWAVTVLDTKSNHWHNVMVDLADGSFVEDIEAVEQAEREARYAEYGKLEPALSEHLVH